MTYPNRRAILNKIFTCHTDSAPQADNMQGEMSMFFDNQVYSIPDMLLQQIFHNTVTN